MITYKAGGYPVLSTTIYTLVNDYGVTPMQKRCDSSETVGNLLYDVGEVLQLL